MTPRWQIDEAKLLARAELTALERDEHVAEWIRLADSVSAQVAPKLSDRGRNGEGRPESGVRKASRDLGIDRDDARRATKVAALSAEAKRAAIVATGQAFIDAKAALPHGQFERLFASHADPLPEPVACSPRTAQRLMAIARDEIISNPTHASLLPSSWDTLYELTKLPDEKLEIALSEGWVSPQTQRRDVKEIRERIVDEATP